ncbi:MAG: response regulator [Deltaproteobacteria bacterium]|nr:response regulator [Deltaproteobacteria bacterium]
MSGKISGRILVVDDDESIRALCREVLTVAGYEVDTAAHGADGLSMLKSGYGLVISDVNMPEVGGLELYSSALREHPQMKDRFLFMTGDCSKLRPIASKDLKCLLKPFRISELLGTVDTIMTRSIEGRGRDERGKRLEERFEAHIECDIIDGGEDGREFLAARALNVSRHGVRVSYEGAALKSRDVSVFMSISRLSLHRTAEVVWSRRLPNGSCACGLKLNEPVPASQLIILNRRQKASAKS